MAWVYGRSHRPLREVSRDNDGGRAPDAPAVEPVVNRQSPTRSDLTYRRDGHADEEHPLFGDFVEPRPRD